VSQGITLINKVSYPTSFYPPILLRVDKDYAIVLTSTDQGSYERRVTLMHVTAAPVVTPEFAYHDGGPTNPISSLGEIWAGITQVDASRFLFVFNPYASSSPPVFLASVGIIRIDHSRPDPVYIEAEVHPGIGSLNGKVVRTQPEVGYYFPGYRFSTLPAINKSGAATFRLVHFPEEGGALPALTVFTVDYMVPDEDDPYIDVPVSVQAGQPGRVANGVDSEGRYRLADAWSVMLSRHHDVNGAFTRNTVRLIGPNQGTVLLPDGPYLSEPVDVDAVGRIVALSDGRFVLFYVDPSFGPSFQYFRVSEQTFSKTDEYFPGVQEAWTVPTDVFSVHITVEGAAGESALVAGGPGGVFEADMPVTPGEVLHFWAGSMGSAGSGGDGPAPGGDCELDAGHGSPLALGGGGGAGSAVYRGGTSASNIIAIVGGGGGAGRGNVPGVGGLGGGPIAGDGGAAADAEGGQGGGQTYSGVGGAGDLVGRDGSPLQGGNGRQFTAGTGGESWCAGAGGGGYRGGGGGGVRIGFGAAGGGGGSTAYSVGEFGTVTNNQGANSGEGKITVTYSPQVGGFPVVLPLIEADGDPVIVDTLGTAPTDAQPVNNAWAMMPDELTAVAAATIPPSGGASFHASARRMILPPDWAYSVNDTIHPDLGLKSPGAGQPREPFSVTEQREDLALALLTSEVALIRVTLVADTVNGTVGMVPGLTSGGV